MSRHARREPGAVAGALDDAGHESGAVELRHLARHADVLVHQRLVVDNHVLVRSFRVGALLEAVRLAAEEVSPEGLFDEVEEGDDGQRAELRARRFAVEEEVEEFEA